MEIIFREGNNRIEECSAAEFNCDWVRSKQNRIIELEKEVAELRDYVDAHPCRGVSCPLCGEGELKKKCEKLEGK